MVRSRNRYVSNTIHTFRFYLEINIHTHVHAHMHTHTQIHTLMRRLITIIEGKREHGLERELGHP